MSSLTMTIEVSPETARRVADDPEALRKVAKIVEDAYGEDSDDQYADDDYKFSPEDMEAIRQGIEDSDAGRFSDGLTNMAHRFEKLRQRQAAALAPEKAA